MVGQHGVKEASRPSANLPILVLPVLLEDIIELKRTPPISEVQNDLRGGDSHAKLPKLRILRT